MNTVKKTIISPKPKLRITEELPVNQERQLTPYELLTGVTLPNVEPKRNKSGLVVPKGIAEPSSFADGVLENLKHLQKEAEKAEKKEIKKQKKEDHKQR